MQQRVVVALAATAQPAGSGSPPGRQRRPPAACGTRSHRPLQPDWLSSQSTARPARCTQVEQVLLVAAARASKSLRPSGENMHGSDAAVLVPHDVTSRKLDDVESSPSSGFVGALIAVEREVVGARGLADHQHAAAAAGRRRGRAHECASSPIG